jgi:type III restriction enzyme
LVGHHPDGDPRNREGEKIKCGAAHFKSALESENLAIYDKFKDVDGLLLRAEIE